MEALHERAKEMRVHETISERSPVCDPSSNGAAEEAVKEVKARARTLMLDLCERIGEAISIEHPIVEWLVQYAAELISRFEPREPFGRAARERWRGSRSNRPSHVLASASGGCRQSTCRGTMRA